MFKLTTVKYSILLTATIVLTTVCIYIPTLKTGFIWDDLNVFLTPLQMGESPYSFFLGGNLYYRPFVHLSLALDFYFWHLNPLGYHLFNIFIHVLNSLLVFFISYNLLENNMSVSEFKKTAVQKNRWLIISFVAALIFAVHPIHIESVAWIAGRTDLLSTFFFLLAFILFVLYTREQKPSALLGMGIFFLFSLFSKENGIALIAILILYGICFKLSFRKLYFPSLTIICVFVVYFILRKGVSAPILPGSTESIYVPLDSLSHFLRILLMGTGFYFEKLIFPLNLNIMTQLPNNPVYYFFVIIPFISGVVFYCKGYKLKLFLTIWIVVTLLPILPIMYSSFPAPVAERYLYLPSVGFAILVPTIFLKIKNQTIIVLSSCLILVTYAFFTNVRIQDWKNPVALWSDSVMKNPNSASAHSIYASTLIKAHEFSRAKNEFLIALKLKELDGLYTKIHDKEGAAIFEGLGYIEFESKNYVKAKEYFEQAIEMNPNNFTVYSNLGHVYYRMSQSGNLLVWEKKDLLKAAISNYKQTLIISPNYLRAKYNIAICYLHLEDFDEAEKYLNDVITSDPKSKFVLKSLELLKLIKTDKAKLTNFINKLYE